MKQFFLLFLVCALLAGCAAPSGNGAGTGANTADAPNQTTETKTETEMKLNIKIEDAVFTATLADTDAARALAARLEEGPCTLRLDDYAGFEKVGALGFSLPANDRRTTTGPGDIVLYQGDQMVMFYGSNTWAYTALAHIDDLSGWEAALGSGSITAVLTLGA